jgi:hypothetical protein
LPLALLAAFAPSAAAQDAPSTTTVVRFVDDLQNPLPTDFVRMRASDGTILTPVANASGSLQIYPRGRKLVLEFTPRFEKPRRMNVMLEDAPVVYLEMMADPMTGHVKYFTQKPYYPVPQEANKVFDLRKGHQGLLFPPANDMCAAPAPIGVGDTLFDTTTATTDGPAACGAIGKDIWFDFLAPGVGTMVAKTCGGASYDSVITAYTGLGCPPGAFLACNDDFCAPLSQISVPVTAGTHYLIRVGGFASASGASTLNISFSGPPANDECVDAPELPCNSSVVADNTFATTNATDPAYSCRFGSPGQGFHTMWYKFMATGTSATIDTEGSTIGDSMLAVYDGTCGALVELACDDDSGTGLLSTLSYAFLTPGNVYYIQVSGFGAGNTGSVHVNLSCTISADPIDDCEDPAEVACGGSVSFDNSAFDTDATDPAYSCRFGGAGQGVGTGWLTFVATASSAFIETNGSSAFDTMLAVYSGTCGAFVELACSDDDGDGLLSQFCVEGLTVGTTYYIQASSYSIFDTGEITVTLTCPCPAPPTNDDCTGAIALAIPSSTILDNSAAVSDAPPPCDIFFGPEQNLWYSVTGTGTTITATTCNGGTEVNDTMIAVYCGDCLAPVCVTGNDDDFACGFNGFFSTVSWCSQPGANYLVTVGIYPGSGAGVIQLDLSANSAPCTPEVVCLPQGGCCLPDGSCVTATSEDCLAQGGVYQGDGTSCDSSAIVDGGFEAGAFSGNWAESSTNFGTPLCDAFCGFGGGTGPHTGDWWAWFGGIPAFEEGAVSQSLVIPLSASTIEFYLEIPVASGNGVDFVELTIDGFQIYEALESDSTGVGYTLVSVPLGGFADGGIHTVEFHSIQTGPDISNFFVDDIAINSSAIECPPPVGSCCLADGSCVEESAVDCAADGGTYGGDNTLCVNADCPQPCVLLNFETEDDLVTPLGNGQQIEVGDEFGIEVNITGAGANLGPAIFDSTPGGPNTISQDQDLLVGLGNMLYLQNSQVPGMTGDFFNTPNDDQDGGDLIFSFTSPVAPLVITLVDIDVGVAQASSVVLTDINGKTRTYTIPTSWTEDLLINGPPGWRTLDLTLLGPQPGFASVATATQQAGYDPTNVVTLKVHLGSSGAVDNLVFCH